LEQTTAIFVEVVCLRKRTGKRYAKDVRRLERLLRDWEDVVAKGRWRVGIAKLTACKDRFRRYYGWEALREEVHDIQTKIAWEKISVLNRDNVVSFEDAKQTKVEPKPLVQSYCFARDDRRMTKILLRRAYGARA